MPEVICPMCDNAITLEEENISLYNHIYCDECGAVLEIVQENPIQLELVEEEMDEEDEDDSEDFL